MADIESPVAVSIVVISGNDYTVYGTVARADIYFAGRLGADVWTGLTTNAKGSALHMARQALDRVTWLGSKTVPSQSAAWPRTGLTDKEGVAVATATVPLEIEFAQYELALAYAKSPTDFLTTSNEQREKRLKAGSAEVEYFASTSTGTGQFPDNVLMLIAIWLSTSGDDEVALAYGTGNETAFPADEDDTSKSDSFDLVRGY